MDETTMKLGLLMEAAQAHQKAAESSLKKLKATANDLAAIVRDEVRRAANVQILVWSVGITALCSAVPLALACWIIPSRAEISALRAKRDELAAQIASLEERGGRIELRRCGVGARLCVRVDRKAPTYGEQSDFLVVRGY